MRHIGHAANAYRPLDPHPNEPELSLALDVLKRETPHDDVARRVTTPHAANPAGNIMVPADPTSERAGGPHSATLPMMVVQKTSLH